MARGSQRDSDDDDCGSGRVDDGELGNGTVDMIAHNGARTDGGPASSLQLLSTISNTYRARHVQAVSLRNLFLPPNEVHVELPTVPQQPAQLSQILSDEEVLSSSDEVHESDGLQSPSSEPDSARSDGHGFSLAKPRTTGKQAGLAAGLPAKSNRPRPARQVSRSMSTAFAEARQKVYEDKILARRLTTFFSLHRIDAEAEENGPIYISEVQERTMNPDFRPLMNEISDQIFLRGRLLVIRIWAKTSEDLDFSLLIEERVALPELHFVAQDLEYYKGDFRDNTLLFYLPDGVYASYMNPSFDSRATNVRSRATGTRSASFDSLMKLKTLVEVIDDAKATQHRITRSIAEVLRDSGDHKLTARATSARDALQKLTHSVSRVARDISKLRHEKEIKIKRRHIRQQVFTRARHNLSLQSDLPMMLRSEISAAQKQRDSILADLRSHSARVAEDLLTIFPVEPIPEEPLSFTIRGCRCPHARAFEQPHMPSFEVEVAAALSFVAIAVDCLSRTLLLHVPYPVQVLGSTSTIRDDITRASELEQNRLLLPGTGAGGREDEGARLFPLYPKGADAARFRYAVYLLNRDIEELVAKRGLRVVDARDTLANVGFLLNSIAGATRDLPMREIGRIAGLQKADESY